MNSTVLFVEMAVGYGGSGRSLLELVARLRGWHPVVLSAFDLSEQADRETRERVEFITSGWTEHPDDGIRTTRILRYAREFRRQLRWTATVIRAIRRARPALVHANNGIHHNLPVILAARLCRVPIVVHQRGWEQFTLSARLAHRLSRHATVIAISKAVADDVRRIPNTNLQVKQVYDVIEGPAVESRRNEEHVTPLMVGIHSMLLPWKGHEVFLEAAAMLISRTAIPLRFIVAGCTPGQDQSFATHLRSAAEALGLTPYIQFVGMQANIYQFLNTLDISVHASVEPEPLGRVIAEAQQAAVAVVATSGGGASELVEPGITGLLVPPGDSEALATALQRLVEHPEYRQQLARNGHAAAARRFDNEQLAAAVDRILAGTAAR